MIRLKIFKVLSALLLLQKVNLVGSGISIVLSQIMSKWPHGEVVIFSSAPIASFDMQSLDLAILELSVVNPAHRSNGKDFDEIFQEMSTYANENQIFFALEPLNVEQATLFLETIGTAEWNKLLPKVVKLCRTATSMVIWPNNSESILHNFQTYISTNETKQRLAKKLPNLSSNVFILQNNAAEKLGKNKAKQWNWYEYYSINGEDIISNSIPANSIGNFIHTRRDFRGNCIHGAAILNSTADLNDLECKIESESGMPVFVGGFSVNILQNIADFFNFRTKPIHSNSQIYRDPNGEWVGIGKLLFENEADISVQKAAYNPLRCKDFTCIMPHFENSVRIYFRQPHASTIRSLLFLPFLPEIWLTIVVTIVVISILLALSTTTSFRSNKIVIDRSDLVLLANSFYWTLGFFCQNGSHVQPKATWLRIIFLTGSFTGLVLYISYSATLVSVLSSETVPIKTLADLVHSSHEIIPDKDSTTVTAILQIRNDTGNRPLIQRLGIPESTQVAAKSIIEDEHLQAFVTFPEVFYGNARKIEASKSDRYLCKNISNIVLNSVPFKSGMIARKNSEYKEYFNNRIIQMYESGVQRRWSLIYVATYNPICDRPSKTGTPLNLELRDLFTGYSIFLTGLGLSVIMLGLELLMFSEKVCANETNVLIL